MEVLLPTKVESDNRWSFHDDDDGYIVSFVHDEREGERKLLAMDCILKRSNLDIGFHGPCEGKGPQQVVSFPSLYGCMAHICCRADT